MRAEAWNIVWSMFRRSGDVHPDDHYDELGHMTTAAKVKNTIGNEKIYTRKTIYKKKDFSILQDVHGPLACW